MNKTAFVKGLLYFKKHKGTCLVLLAVFMISGFLFLADDVLSGVSYDHYKSSSKNLWERKAVYLWRNVKIIISELTAAIGNNAEHPPSDKLKRAVGSGSDPSSLVYQHNELKQNAGKHFMPPPDLTAIKNLCARINSLTPKQRIDKIDAEITKMQTKVMDLTKIARDADKVMKQINLKAFARAFEQSLKKGVDIAGVIKEPSKLPETLARWCGEMAMKQSTKLKIPKGDFVRQHKTDIHNMLIKFLNKYQPGRKARWLDILDKLNKGRSIDSLSNFEKQEFEIIVKKYHEFIRNIARKESSDLIEKIKKKQNEKDAIKKKKNQVHKNITAYKAICAKIMSLTDWTKVNPKSMLFLTKGVKTGTTTSPGKTITYTFTVENKGNVRIEQVDISDNKCSPVTLTAGKRELDPGDIAVFECSSLPMKAETITNMAIATGIDAFGKVVRSTMSTVTVKVKTPKVIVPDVRGYKLKAAEDELIMAKLKLNKDVKTKKSDAPVGEVVDQSPGPGKKAAAGSMVTVWISEEEPHHIFVDPPRVTIKVGEQVSFTAHLVKEDGSSKVLSLREATWSPGPANIFEGTEEGEFTVTVTAEGLRGFATVTVEEEEKTEWEPPISHSDQLTAKALPPPPDAFTWYALCNKSTGDVVYGETTDPVKYEVLFGPFQGPRDAKMWIDQNIPSWRCPSKTGIRGQWNVLCNKQSYSVVFGKSVDPTRFWIMAGGFAGEPEARAWASANCPGGICTEGGGCAAGPRGGGDWAVICSKGHGGVGLTRHPDPTTHWIFANGLRGEKDARLWTNMYCPSWRCDAYGQCLPGVRSERDKPLELPPEFDVEDEVRGDDAERASRERKQERTSEEDTERQRRNYETGRKLGELLGKVLVGKAAEELREKEERKREPDRGRDPFESQPKTADCSRLRDQFQKRSDDMVNNAKKLNCEQNNHYSGCALDVVGPFFPYWPSKVFSDEACASGYADCMTGPFSGYLGCLDSCNSAARSGGGDLKTCGQKCFKQMQDADKRCQEKLR